MTRHSATAQDLFDEFAAEQLAKPGVGRRRMFGHEGLNVNGKFFAFLNGDQLVLKLPPATARALIAAGEAAAAETMSPTMRERVSLLWTSEKKVTRKVHLEGFGPLTPSSEVRC